MADSELHSRTAPIGRGLAVIVIALVVIAAGYAAWIGIINYAHIKV